MPAPVGETPTPAPAAPATRRAIVVSFDALSEGRALDPAISAAAPNFRRLFAEGACAASARPAFPSVTAPGHAALWTGAYGDVNGVAANSQPVLPQPDHTLLESISGFSAEALRAEPIWLAAAASGRAVVAHHVTQAPAAPGYRPVRGPDARLDALRAAAESLLALPATEVLNGYNRQIAASVVLTERTAPPRPAAGWQNVARLGRTVAPRELVLAVGGDTLFVLLHGAARYDRVLVATRRDAAAGVQAVLAPVERAPVAGRALARHFSAPLELPVSGGRVYVRVRLFDLSADGARYMLYIPELRVVEGNRPEVAAAYDAAVQGWYGNGASYAAARGAFGPTLADGGDGTAEYRYLESLELVTGQFVRGAEWAWTTRRPALLLDYFPLIDEVDHMLYGFVEPRAPAYDAALAERVQEVRARAWALADLRLAHLRALVGRDPDVALFVSGDHGMRASWRVFRPNVALADAGLLARDSTGRIDLARTRALSPNGYWVMVNRTAWKDGIVPPADEAAVLDAAARALQGARGDDDAPIVTRLWRAADHDSLGLGGPVGGDLYYEVADGYHWSADARGAVASAASPRAGHGFPSVAPDMHTVLCASGAAFAPRRTGMVRTIDLAPTVAEWLGIRAPMHAVGRSLLETLRGR